MILVTGAAGKTGRAVLRALASSSTPVRALVHRPAQLETALAAGAHSALAGELDSPTVLSQALQGVRAVYYICPNLHPDEPGLVALALAAARAAGVEHFVYHSVLHPQTEAMPHHWGKLRAEEQLFTAGIPFTILQPAAYMQNVLGYWRAITTEGRYPVPYAVTTRLGLVDLDDVAAVATLVLTQPGHAGAIYELAGAEVLTQTELAARLSAHLGQPVQAVAVPLETWERQARAAGLGDYQVTTLLKMFRYYEAYGFWGNPNVLRWLLGRPPTTFAEFLARLP